LDLLEPTKDPTEDVELSVDESSCNNVREELELSVDVLCSKVRGELKP